jgi:hypothetical protein
MFHQMGFKLGASPPRIFKCVSGHMYVLKIFSLFTIQHKCLSLSVNFSQWPHGLRQKCLHPLEHWVRGFESHWRLSVFILCLCCPVYIVALQWADLLSKEPYQLSKIKKLKWNWGVLQMPCVPSGSNRNKDRLTESLL